jgi:hypothetical protein
VTRDDYRDEFIDLQLQLPPSRFEGLSQRALGRQALPKSLSPAVVVMAALRQKGARIAFPLAQP